MPLTPQGGQTLGGEALWAPDLRVSQKGLTNPILPPAERPLSGKKAGLKLASWGGKKGKAWSFLSQWFLVLSFSFQLLSVSLKGLSKGIWFLL